MRIARSFVVLALGLGTACASAQASAPLSRHEDNERRAGDWLQYGIPLSALALTFVLTPQPAGPGRENFDTNELIHLNGSPRHDLLLAAGRAFVITEGLKYAINERRPNGGLHSFPSGHTSIAFTGAEFIR